MKSSILEVPDEVGASSQKQRQSVCPAEVSFKSLDLEEHLSSNTPLLGETANRSRKGKGPN